MGKTLVLTLAILSLVEYMSATSVICYHGTWSHYRTGNGKFPVSNTPANLCTHYIYAFFALDSTSYEVKSWDPWLDISLNGLSDAVALKSRNPNLKVLIAVGGWNEGSSKYSVMAADKSKRANFISSALKWVQDYGFDGFDLDWEFPGRRDSTNLADKTNLALLLKEMYEVFNPLGLILTAAVSATPSSVDISYDVSALSKYLDFINVMTYDFHGAWDTIVSHNSPLYSAERFVGTEFADYSINASIRGWISRGAPPSKIALGLPFYGRNAILTSSSNTAPGSASTNTGGAPGPYTATSGFWGYNEIVEKFNEGGWTTLWDHEQQVPYAYKGTTWLSYDNEISLKIKVEYAKSLGLGAIMIWSIETEDFLGLSGTKYPLLTTINNALGSSTIGSSDKSSIIGSSKSSSTSTSSSVSTAATSTTTALTTTTSYGVNSSDTIADSNSCAATGYFRSSSDCSVYFYCQQVGTSYAGTTFSCGQGLYYDITLGVCNFQSSVIC